jgi:uncharacterized protein YndB with AHSA1/START domain
MSKMKIVKTLFLKAPPEHVWKFLTDKDCLAEWFHRGEADIAEGGDYKLVANSYRNEGKALISGKVLEATKPEKLVHTFTHDHLKGVETTCAWTLEAVKGGTILTLVHEGWENYEEDPFGMAANHDAGWDEHFLRMRRVAS